jgi:hypothetical protein
MPKAMVKRAVKVNPGDLRKERMLIRRFSSKASMNPPRTKVRYETCTFLAKSLFGEMPVFSQLRPSGLPEGIPVVRN